MGMVGWLEYDESRCVTIWTFTWGRAEALKSAEMILAFNESWFPHCACLSSEKKPYCHLSLVCEQDFWILKGWQWWGIQWYRVVRPSPTLHLSDCHNFRTPLGSPSDGSWWCSLLPACFHLMAHGPWFSPSLGFPEALDFGGFLIRLHMVEFQFMIQWCVYIYNYTHTSNDIHI